MTRRTVRWLLAGVLAWLVFLWATFPAAYALHWLQPNLRDVQLSGVEGSIWSGQAAQLAFQSVPLGAVRWSFDWRAPWSGKLGYHLHLNDGSLALDGRAAMGRGGQLVLRDLTGRLPVSRLDHWIPLPSDSVDGIVQLNLSKLAITRGLPQTAEGTVTVTEAILHWPETAALGSYQMKLHTDRNIAGSIRDSGGPLSLQAQFQLQANGHYSVTGSVSPRDKGSAAAHLLTYLGSPAANGSYRLNFTGQL